MPGHDLADALPNIATLRARCRALAVVEAIISLDWESRYYSVDAAWDDRLEMASMRNGGGDECSIAFTPAGVFIRGFDHESRMSPAGNDERGVARTALRRPRRIPSAGRRADVQFQRPFGRRRSARGVKPETPGRTLAASTSRRCTATAPIRMDRACWTSCATPPR